MAFGRVFQQSLLRCASTTETASLLRHFSVTTATNDSYKLVVVGGGAGGCSTAAKFCRALGDGQVAVIEPNEKHFYQPMWTLVGAGLKTMDQSQRSMSSVMPSQCRWVKDSVIQFDPKNNEVTTVSGKKIHYEYLVVAMGLQLNYDKVKGLTEALHTDRSVCSNYHARYVTKTFPALQDTDKGNAIFTFPNTPIKCAGAPQKIMYLAEEIFRDRGVRKDVNVIYNTSLPVIFGVKRYADSLDKIVKERNIQVNYRHNLVEVRPDSKEAVFHLIYTMHTVYNTQYTLYTTHSIYTVYVCIPGTSRNIQVNYRHNLVEVRPDSKEAVFQLLDSEDGKTVTFKYSFLHATPPMSASDVLRSSPLVNADGWLSVDKMTLQHTQYPNIFGLGDCTSLPTSRTAAAVAAQCGIVKANLTAVMQGKQLTQSYDGYTSCPIITGKNKCILAEFDYDGEPLETFPVDQSLERRSMYLMKAQVMPQLYWTAMIKGMWKGPALFRKMMHLGMGR
ncbi:hypothetical protein ACOMHN_030442 [Nucella lapillus]